MTSFHASDPDGSASDSRIIYRRTVIGEGHTDRDIGRALRDQQIERLRQGSYVSSSAYADLEDYERAEPGTATWSSLRRVVEARVDS